MVRSGLVSSPLTGQVAGEQQAGTDLVLIQELEQVDTLDSSAFFKGDRKAEPGRVAIGRGFGDFQEIAQTGKTILEQLEVALASVDEVLCTLQLSKATCRLHVGNFQVVA
ncbi:hypothetical protein D3C84_924360 [compost metagenome]